jgi:glucose-1-phosphate thymidylyltransferase
LSIGSGAPAVAGDVIALIPAAGEARRLGPLPCSKELLAVGWHREGGALQPKVVTQYLLERLRAAGIERAYLILRPGKWDIPAYLGDGAALGMGLEYLIMGPPYGSPYTLDQAYAFVAGRRIALGFPDILFEPADAYGRLLARQERSGAEVVLGLFPAQTPEKMDMVETDGRGRVREIHIKPRATALRLTWIIAVWTPAFTGFMHAYLAEILDAVRAGAYPDKDRPREPYVGDVLRAALRAGMVVETVRFEAGWCLDIGTPEDLDRALRRFCMPPS